MKKQINPKTDRILYLIGWVIVACATVFILVLKQYGQTIMHVMPPCLFHLLTGYYCPGCGGTRALHALLGGHFLLSLQYHPVLLFVLLLGGWFMISQTIQRISKNRIAIGMHYREIYLWLILVLVVVNCLIKNVMLAVWHIDMLARI